jgi:hypothetical protein
LKKSDNSIHGGVSLEDQKLQIECGRCGKTMPGLLTEVEARTIRDGVGPVYRYCDRCEQTTGWIEAAAMHDEMEIALQQLDASRSPSGSSNDWPNDRPVAHGHERLATTSERDEVNAMRFKRENEANQ